ncbi:hypothetical protein SteCoe_30942 [Stentor coeruleus]|uniref:Uncharacterized protein n=1 Tax=Stentor coeruleus TaxID=5963 RepID=A0A1R2B2G5_9CILI|nr:hypothetical protein SteCoe_30942 [Stentor coeruleus]
MKKSSLILEGSPSLMSKNSKNGTRKGLYTSNRTKTRKEPEYRYGLPPMAPHNTTQDIINSHPNILYDEEELMGWFPSILSTVV